FYTFSHLYFYTFGYLYIYTFIHLAIYTFIQLGLSQKIFTVGFGMIMNLTSATKKLPKGLMYLMSQWLSAGFVNSAVMLLPDQQA
ncbi:MAG: hypothetical protein EOP45_14665, partial [Sphingobacteriaceae bacterium]